MEEELKLLFLIPDPTFSHSGSGIFSFWIRRFLILDPAFPHSGSGIFSFWIRHFLILDPAFSHSGFAISSFWIRHFLILDPAFSILDPESLVYSESYFCSRISTLEVLLSELSPALD